MTLIGLRICQLQIHSKTIIIGVMYKSFVELITNHNIFYSIDDLQ